MRLPRQAILGQVRAAAERRSAPEIKALVNDWLLCEAQGSNDATVVRTGFNPMGPARFNTQRDLASVLALLRDGGLPPAGRYDTGFDQPDRVPSASVGTSQPADGCSHAHHPDNPFPGLRPFEPDEARLFFGRGPHTRELLRKLRRNRFLAVVGTSGSGKSSLVRAGLLPTLCSGELPGSGSSWRIALFRPGGDPIGELARSLSAPGVLVGNDAGTEPDDRRLHAMLCETTLRRSALGLSQAVRDARLADGENLLVVVDQFEELFRFKREAKGRHGAEESAAFVKLLLEASRATGSPVYVVLTMRSDYLGDCAQFRGLPEAINDAQYLIPRLSRDQRRETITAPVRVAGATITPRLVQRLLNDVGDNPDQLPILQHALMRTWDQWAATSEHGQSLDTEHYQHIGGMTEALSRHANEIYWVLDGSRRRHIAERLFKGLTDRSGDGRGIRKATRLDRLSAYAEAGTDEVIEVIDAFREPGCSFLMPPAGTPLAADTVIDISHESLMRVWTLLKDWVAEETDSARTYHRLAETAALNRADKAGLWSEPDLTQALDWRRHQRPNARWARRYHAAFTTAMKFLDRSDQAARQASRRLRRTVVGGLVLFGSIAAVMTVMYLDAQKHLNRTKAFVDTERVEDIQTKCALLFAPNEIISGQTGWEEQKRQCAEVLGEVSGLIDGLPIHRKSLDKLDQDDQLISDYLYENTDKLVNDLEHWHGQSWLARNRTRGVVLNAVVAAYQDLVAIKLLQSSCKLLFSPHTLAPGTFTAGAEACRKAYKADTDRFAVAADRYRSAKKLLDRTHPALDARLDLAGFVLRIQPDRFNAQIEATLTAAVDSGSWREVADKVKSDPCYRDLNSYPKAGLVPLGPDPDSGLLEFAHIGSGRPPLRDPGGRLMIDGNTAIVLVLIPGGRFIMGSKSGAYDEMPPHAVTLPAFLLSKYEVTEAQWGLLGGSDRKSRDDPVLPMEDENFAAAQSLTELAGLRLPSEAEWEYAARAGTETEFWWGDSGDVTDVANCTDCPLTARSAAHSGTGPMPVGSLRANGFGLHDTAGNTREWTADCYHENYQDAPDNGSAWLESSGCQHVQRGGDWTDIPHALRSAYRFEGYTTNGGLRPARSW